MSHLSRLVLISVGAWALGSACGSDKGNGIIVTQERTVPAFSRVEVEDGLQVAISRGDRRVAITTDENLVDFFEFDVDGETLKIRRTGNKNIEPTGVELIELNTNVLEGLQVRDGSNVSADATQAGEWRLNISDASSVSITGLEAAQLKLKISKESRVDVFGRAVGVDIEAKSRSQVNADALAAQNVKVDAEGGSLVFVNASSSIKAKASGDSFVTVSGSPPDRSIDANRGSSVSFTSN